MTDRPRGEEEDVLDEAYDLLTSQTDFYTCRLNGTCERSQTSKLTLEQCQAQCQSTEYRDLIGIILAYEPGRGYELAPSDQNRVMIEITGYRYAGARVTAMYFDALKRNDFTELRNVRSADHYRYKLYDPLSELIEYSKDIIGVSHRLPLDELLLREIVLEIVSEAFYKHGTLVIRSESGGHWEMDESRPASLDDQRYYMVREIYDELKDMFTTTRPPKDCHYCYDDDDEVGHEYLGPTSKVNWMLILDIINSEEKNLPDSK